MCNACFDREYLSFPSQQDFDKFDLELTEKLKSGGLKYVKDGGSYLKFGYSIYQCDNCNTTWWLDAPENAWRGFFAHADTAKSLLDKFTADDKKKQIGCLIILAAILTVVGVYIFKTCS